MNSLFDGLALGEIKQGQPEAEYHAVRAISSSGIRTAFDARSPRALYGYLQGISGSIDASAASFGGAVHARVLEPDVFEAEWVRKPDINKRTKAGKAEWAQWQEDNADKHVLVDGRGTCIYDDVMRTSDAVLAHAEARAVLEATSMERRELSLYADDQGLSQKARVDIAPDAGAVLYDLKTSRDASPGGFARSVESYKYHVQAAHYLALAELCGIAAKHFSFFVVEKSEPHFVGVYPLDTKYLDLGRRIRDAVLSSYIAWRATVGMVDRDGELRAVGYGTHVLSPKPWSDRDLDSYLEAAS